MISKAVVNKVVQLVGAMLLFEESTHRFSFQFLSFLINFQFISYLFLIHVLFSPIHFLFLSYLLLIPFIFIAYSFLFISVSSFFLSHSLPFNFCLNLGNSPKPNKSFVFNCSFQAQNQFCKGVVTRKVWGERMLSIMSIQFPFISSILFIPIHFL